MSDVEGRERKKLTDSEYNRFRTISDEYLSLQQVSFPSFFTSLFIIFRVYLDIYLDILFRMVFWKEVPNHINILNSSSSLLTSSSILGVLWD